MRNSMAQLTPRFSTNRVVREYTECHYLPAAAAYHERSADKGALGAQVSDWRHALAQNWPTLRFGEMTVETEGGQHVFVVHVYLNDLDPEAVRVELYADAIFGGIPVRHEMTRMHPLIAAVTGFAYHASVPADRPESDYTIRLIPRHHAAEVPLEAAWILWER